MIIVFTNDLDNLSKTSFLLCQLDDKFQDSIWTLLKNKVQEILKNHRPVSYFEISTENAFRPVDNVFNWNRLCNRLMEVVQEHLVNKVSK
jgi:hypothetical protein